MIGFAAGEIPRIALNLTLLKGCSIVGVFWGAFLRRDAARTKEHFRELVSLFEGGKLKPAVTGTYSLERAAEALTALMERRVKGKIAIVPGLQ